MQKLDIHLLKESRCRHTHDFPQIILPLEETLHIWIGDRNYDVEPQKLCYIPPDTLHQCMFMSGLLVIDIPRYLISEQDRNVLTLPMVTRVKNHLEPLVDLIKAEITENPNSTAIYYLYYYLYSKLMENQATLSLRYIQEHYNEDITVQQLAEMENYNITYFNDWFKQQTGSSPYVYLRNVRVSKAKELLAATDFSIVEIASMIGYGSHSAFTRAFHSVTGMTPKDFRALYQNP